MATITNTMESQVECEDSKENRTIERTYKTVSLSWDEKSAFLFAGCDNGLLKIIEVTKKTL